MQNSKVLVIGDLIIDHYRYFSCNRICPEAPVPVLVSQETDRKTDGGAGLVAAQLREFMGYDAVQTLYGSTSIKERLFCDGHLVCRIDKDRDHVFSRDHFYEKIAREVEGHDLVIVSDYGKGAMDDTAAELLFNETNRLNIPVLVDAKKTWGWYCGAYAFFPNLSEKPAVPKNCAKHVIQKLGKDGCEVDGVHLENEKDHSVRDVTGAGDIFLAAFAVKMLELGFPQQSGITLPEDCKLQSAAAYASRVAGISVEHAGTYVVPKGDYDLPSIFSFDKNSGLWYPTKD